MKSPKEIADKALLEADALEEAGDLDGARARLQASFDGASEVPRFRAHLGRLLYLDEQWEDAIAEFDAALSMVPTAAATLFFRAKARYGVGDLNGAFADYEKTFQLQPESCDALYGMAKVRDYQGKFEEALSYLRQVETIDKEYLDVKDFIAHLEGVASRRAQNSD